MASTFGRFLTLTSPFWAYLLLPDAHASVVSINLDNDVVFATDGEYTNGLTVGYATAFSDQQNTALAGISPLNAKTRYIGSLSGGQKMWTPTDLSYETPQPNERPYAGLLYLQGELTAVGAMSVHTLGLLAGVTGQDSLAASAQQRVHSWFKWREPIGWDQQISQQLVVNASWQGEFLLNQRHSAGVVSETSINNRILAGNYRSELASGILWRWGTGLSTSLGSTKISTETSLNPALIKQGSEGAYIYSGIEGRYRINDITIEGDRPAAVYPTSVEHWQGTVTLGSVWFDDEFGVSASISIRSKDFSQAKDDLVGNGSLMLFWFF